MQILQGLIKSETSATITRTLKLKSETSATIATITTNKLNHSYSIIA